MPIDNAALKGGVARSDRDVRYTLAYEHSTARKGVPGVAMAAPLMTTLGEHLAERRGEPRPAAPTTTRYRGGSALPGDLGSAIVGRILASARGDEEVHSTRQLWDIIETARVEVLLQQELLELDRIDEIEEDELEDLSEEQYSDGKPHDLTRRRLCDLLDLEPGVYGHLTPLELIQSAREHAQARVAELEAVLAARRRPLGRPTRRMSAPTCPPPRVQHHAISLAHGRERRASHASRRPAASSSRSSGGGSDGSDSDGPGSARRLIAAARPIGDAR